jgi:hypothetical protein
MPGMVRRLFDFFCGGCVDGEGGDDEGARRGNPTVGHGKLVDFLYMRGIDDRQERSVADFVPTIPAVTGRSFESTVRLAIQAGLETHGPVIMMFADIAVQVDPGDDAETITRNYDEAAALILVRLSAMPLLTERAPIRGDIIETLVDDHSTRTMKGAAGIVTDVEASAREEVHKIVVRFARRTVDYLPEDFKDLRYIR